MAVALALFVGTLTAYGERVRTAGLWELISVTVVGAVPMSMSFVPLRGVMESESWRRWPFERSFWWVGGMEVD